MVAIFLRFYNGYTLSTLMKEPAHWFFSLLNQAFKLDADEHFKWLGVVAYPHMKQQQANELRSAYVDAGRDILEILTDYEDNSGIDKLKKEMGT
jgi:hypothetical protein